MNDPATPSRTPAWLAPVLCVVLLAGLGAVNLGFPTAGDAAPYHDAVRATLDAAPTSFGRWASRPVELPPSAVEMLRPNATRSRSFYHADDGRRAELLVVQCRDARDLAGHWPPNCFKATGYTLLDARRRDFDVHDPDDPGRPTQLPGVEYLFETTTAHGTLRIAVANFMILPGVGYVPDMDGVRTAGADPRRRHLGAAQVQVVTDAELTPAARDAVFSELMRPHLPAVRAIADADTR